MRVEILGHERRPRRRDEDKLAIVTSVAEAGATITEIAHRHDVARQQIYASRGVGPTGDVVGRDRLASS
ncbi:transposase [Neorhizobium galegae]|uniref:transposase n=1 Tax=Neorhizobium galegae TaxID=399 RepID=UPI000B2A97C5|nr:transposase [Neorhizobium galegae]